MEAFLASSAAGYLAIFMAVFGAASAVYLAITLNDSPLRDIYERYVASLDDTLKFLLSRTTGAQIARGQGIAAAALLIALAITGDVLVLAVMLVVAVAPHFMLQSQKKERVLKLESQLDGWLMMLSNALKATPAIGEALKSTASLVQAPMAQELDLIVKENQLGTPVDQALMNAGRRINSAVVSGALATLVIARQTGGDLPRILETSAKSLREMSRLEGVVRTKTAEGKGQVVVLAVVPFLMVGILGWMDPNWLKPLTANIFGFMVVGAAAFLWFVAIIWARTILDVDV